VFRIGATDATYACWFQRPKPFPLDEPMVQDNLRRPVRLAGRFAAVFFLVLFPDSTATTTVAVLDLPRREGAENYPSRYGRPNPPGPVKAMVLTSSGNVAFVSCDPGFQSLDSLRCAAEDPAYQAIRVNRDGARTLLDSGNDIDPRSLRLKPGKVVWLNDGRPRSAGLR
jgi:hypothetical protein